MILLGDPALGALDLPFVLEITEASHGLLLLCPVLSPPGLVRRWESGARSRRILPSELPARLEAVRQVPVRLVPRLEDWAGDWLRSCACGRCIGYFEAVGSLRHLLPAAWAESLGIEGRDLWFALRTCLGVGPGKVLRRFKVAVAAREEAEGWTRKRIAASVPYSGVRGLARLRRRE